MRAMLTVNCNTLTISWQPLFFLSFLLKSYFGNIEGLWKRCQGQRLKKTKGTWSFKKNLGHCFCAFAREWHYSSDSSRHSLRWCRNAFLGSLFSAASQPQRKKVSKQHDDHHHSTKKWWCLLSEADNTTTMTGALPLCDVHFQSGFLPSHLKASLVVNKD